MLPMGVIPSEGGFELATMNGLNSCAIDLRQIGRAIDAETHDGGFHGPQLDADVRQPEIDDEELREGRGATQELGIDIGEAAEVATATS